MADSMLLVGKIGDGDHELRPQTFMHPKHDRECCYLIGTRNVYELQTVSDEEHCSLFIDDFVSESNAVHVVNRIDPMFLLIPSLLRNRKKSQISESFCSSPLDQLLDERVRTDILSKLESPMDLEAICNVQQIDEEVYCVLNDDKVLQFLDSKLTAIQEIVSGLNDALCVLNEYVPPYFFEKLCDHRKVSSAKVLNPRNQRKRKRDIAGDEEAESLKKPKMDLAENMNRMNVHGQCHDEARVRMESKPKPKATPRSRSINKLSKADTSGMKSMMSYFRKSKK